MLDPALSPGTGTPEPGGIPSADLLRMVRQLCLEHDVVGVDVVEGLGAGAVPVAGSVFGGFVIVVTCDVSPETATNAAATPPRPSTKITVMTMIGMRQLPGRRMRVVAA